MRLTIATALSLYLSTNVLALTDSMASATQEPKIELSGRPDEEKPSRSTISGAIELNGTDVPDSFYVGIEELKLKWRPFVVRPKNTRTLGTTEFTFDVEPGLYTIVISAFGCETLKTSVLVPDTDTHVYFTANLEPFGLKPGFEWVKLWGDFCRWRPWGAIEMVQKDSVWVVPGDNPVKVGDGYRFIVSNGGSDVYDLSHSNAIPNPRSLVAFNSIYEGGEIIFDPSHYVQPKTDSRAEFSSAGHQAAFAALVDELDTFQKRNMRVLFSKRDSARSSKNDVSAFIKRHEKFREIANRYPAYFEQLFLKIEFGFLKRFHPHAEAMKAIRSLKHNKQEFENKRRDHFQSTVYESYFSQMAQLAKKMDPNSVFFQTYDTYAYLNLDEGLYQAPHLGEKYDVPPFFFTGILATHERNLPPDSREGETLLWTVAQHYREFGNVVAAGNALTYLIRKYPNSRTVLGGSVDRMSNALNLREESAAPEFVAPAVGRDSLRLSDYSGKFVFLDFWATWCGPCINELPNLKKLHESFTDDGLTVIGLAHNNPRDLEDYIRIHEIPYANGISTEEVERAYGIVAWPTTFLIAPDGEIIAKNLRGEGLVDLVKQKITEYNSQ